MEQMKFIIVAIVIVFILLSQSTYSCANFNTWQYYATYTEVFENGLLVDTSLNLRPSENIILANNFQHHIVIGSTPTDNKLPLESAAKHHAITLLLINNGLKSIKSYRTIVNTDYADQVIMTYAGVVEFPIKTISYKCTKGNNIIEGVFEINFSPVAFPTMWPYLKIKNRFSVFTKNFIDLLY
ncbi:MAG: hypothetical protein U9R29_07855 [Thermodesulfobacteriota bacterium]|nr:hypothetical protein [Thermodesulfobacteriota bacterium]